MSQERKLEILTALFFTVLVSATLLGGKMTSVFGIGMSVGIFMYPLTFFIINIIEESIGANSAKKFIKLGLISLLVIFIFTWIATFLKPNERYFFDQAYNLIFSNSLRLIIATLITFWLSVKFNIWAFHYFKKKVQPFIAKYSWLCAAHNLAIISSQLIETLIFVFIAYYGSDSSSDSWSLIKIIIPYWLIKSLLTTIATPIYFYGVRWLKGNTAQ
ncbi:MAG: queuosine precursor transporter [Patescibacteria group bacterium]